MIRETYDLSVEEKIAHTKAYGDYNSFPPNWREVTAEDIATKCLVRIYTPKITEYRQIGSLKPGSPPVMACTLWFFHDGTGYAVHYDYWKKTIRYFMFARCIHTYKALSRPAGNRSGLHEEQCTQCDYINSYDTSG